MDSKKFYESKTFWFNILAALVAIASLFGFAEFAPDENAGEIIALAISFINLALRFVTSKPVTLQ